MKRVSVIAVELKSASSYLFICWKLEFLVSSWTSREWSVFQLWTIWNWEHRYIVCTLKQIYRYRYHSVAIGTLFMLVYYVFKPICMHRITSGSMCLWSHFVLELYLFYFITYFLLHDHHHQSFIPSERRRWDLERDRLWISSFVTETDEGYLFDRMPKWALAFISSLSGSSLPSCSDSIIVARKS